MSKLKLPDIYNFMNSHLVIIVYYIIIYTTMITSVEVTEITGLYKFNFWMSNMYTDCTLGDIEFLFHFL